MKMSSQIVSLLMSLIKTESILYVYEYTFGEAHNKLGDMCTCYIIT